MISSRLKISFFQFLSFHLIIRFTLISSNFFEPFNVTYDQRALIIDGHRRMLISAGIHYPRATPEMWPDLIAKSKEGGADVVQTYVFWSGHEPVKGQYYFEGSYDLVKFVKLVGESGLYLHLRIGPYVCAEWNFGGFPVWLRDVPGIVFRTDNAPFKVLQEVPGLHGDVSGDFGLAKLLNKEDHASTALPTINVSRTSCRHTLWIQIGLLVSRHSSSLMESPGEFPTQKDTNKNFSHEASVVFVLGGPASGKGTQCPKIVEHFGFTHLCVGELLEEETKSGSENGKMIRNFKLEGKIVPSEVTMGILQKAMQQSENKKFIIDGFPRNEENRATFEKTVKVEPEFVLFFDPPKRS